ncbi:MAG TPA: response regulator [Candidatus Saccharimonadia bacterium]|nr:response regulator [Candidatus Saccharimonadia bacterium]
MHVLLIEPDRVQAGLIAEALGRNGHTVARAISAQSAVQMADERLPDVVILELQLSRHNGIEFLYEFRSYPEWLAIPAIIYSYVPKQELAHAATVCHELGVVRTLYKPETDLTTLCNAVAKAGVAAAL